MISEDELTPIALPAHPGGAFGRITRELRAHLIELKQKHPGSLLAVACSGGADSLSLAAALASVGPGLGFRLAAITVNHGWRAESRKESEDVQKLLCRLGYANTAILNLDENGRTNRAQSAPGTKEAGIAGNADKTTRVQTLGLEAESRVGRYRAIKVWAASQGQLGKDVFILFGHTQDDQAETVLLGLARGSGLRAISAMCYQRGGYLRPLLEIRRLDTEASCVQLGLPYVVDPSNLPDSAIRAADGYPLRRSAVRYQALPALKQALQVDPKPALAKTARQLQEDLAALDHWAEQAFETACVKTTDDRRLAKAEVSPAQIVLVIDTKELVDLPVAIRKRIWRLATLNAGARAGDVRAVQLQQLDRLVTQRRKIGPVDLPGGVAAKRIAGTWLLVLFVSNVEK